jgi:chromosome segregation ATPase
MNNINFFSQRLLILLSALLFPGLCALPVQAQNDPGSLRFLESFAIQAFEQGNIQQSTKDFERILLIDPENKTAQDYLARTAKGLVPRVKTDDQSLAILADLSYLRKEARSRESEFKELSGLIRELVTENDQLYMSLHKRTREVMELREKLFGNTYSEQYLSETAELQPERVPQNLLRAGEILKELEKRQPLASATTVVNQPSSAENQKLLVEQRALMIGQNASVTADIEQLNALKTSLTRINSDLKGSETAAIAAVDRIEKYFGELRSKINYNDPRQESEINNIKSQLAERSAELNKLRADTAARDESLSGLKNSLAQSNKTVAQLNEQIVQLTQEIATLKQTLATEKEQRTRANETLNLRANEISELKIQSEQRKTQMNEKDAAISLQQKDLALVDRSLTDIERELSAVEASLETGDRELDELSGRLQKISPSATQGH